MNALPFEILQIILDLLPIPDLLSLSHLNRHWHTITSNTLYKVPIIKSKQQLELFIRIAEKTQLYVQVLDLTHVHAYVKDIVFQSLSHLHNLKHINLSKCTQVSPYSILSLIKSNMTHLDTLLLANCTLSTEILTHIGQANHHKLRLLDLSNTMIKPCITFDSYNHLDTMIALPFTSSHLEYLDLSYCTWVNSQTVENVASGLPKLEHIILQWCSSIKLNAIDILVQKLTRLNTIDIRHAETITNSEQAVKVLDHAVSAEKILFTYKRMNAQVVYIR